MSLASPPPASTGGLSPLASSAANPLSAPASGRGPGSKRFLPRLTTPLGFTLGLVSVWASSAIVLLVSLGGLQHQRHAIQGVGQEAAPSILLAQRLQDSLTDLDANVANELLVPPGRNPEATQAIQERQRKLANYLIAIAGNVSEGNQEKRPITILQFEYGNYLLQAQAARSLNQQGNRAGAIAAYQQASQVLQQRLLPAATALSTLKRQQLGRVYSTHQQQQQRNLVVIALGGATLLGVLLGLQRFVSQRTQRQFNLGLLVATVVAGGFCGSLWRGMGQSSQQLERLQAKVFPALLSIRESRTLAYSTQGETSRWLLTQQVERSASQTANSQTANSQTANSQTIVTQMAASQSAASVLQVLQNRSQQSQTTAQADQTAENQALEAQAIRQTQEAWQTYSNITQAATISAKTGRGTEAIAQATGYQEGQANWAFQKFKDNHQALIDLDEARFAQTLLASTQSLEGAEARTIGAIALVVVAATVGMWPRLKEYQ